MKARVIRYALAMLLAVVGVGAVTASPAMATIVGGCNTSNSTLKPCTNWGDDGNYVRGDFYLDHGPDLAIYSYTEKIVDHLSSGPTYTYWYNNGARTLLTHTGRYCCEYAWMQSLPVQTHNVYTEVSIYTKSGTLHMTVRSATYRFNA
jgi:hypothetical protein